MRFIECTVRRFTAVELNG